jgi:probable rRNA maturation factor
MKDDPLITYRRKPAALDANSLELFAGILRDRVARGRVFHCRVTSDAELQSLNARYRGKDYPADVLSFPLADGQYIGDIAISFARARAQAREWGHAAEDELRILMLHGVLHLLGFDHESDSGRMRRAESRWRRELGLRNGLIERARAAS